MKTIQKYPVEITDEHLDIFGHVNVLHYYKFFDEAKWDYSSRNGFGLDHVKRLRQGPILLEQNVKFLREVGLGDRVEVHTMAVAHGLKTTTGVQLLVKPSGKVACRADFILGYFDTSKRRLVALSPEWRAATPIVNERKATFERGIPESM